MGLDNYIEFAMKSLLKDILPPSISYSLFLQAPLLQARITTLYRRKKQYQNPHNNSHIASYINM
jgi:hypothetical protein